ncbi:MAG: ATP-binding protein [Verrucomicrobiota bacterium]|nr:ATP-binding protein [Verrucomicrobiota bacterium]
MFEDLLTEQNPHWAGHVYDEGIEREQFKALLKYLPLPQIISVVGVRRAGKSTLLKQLINHLIAQEKVNPKNILFLNLEHPYFAQYCTEVKYLERAFEDFLKIALPQKEKIYCFLDEVQFFHQWPVFVKAHFEQKNVKFILTGSNSQLLSSDLLTLLSGRTLPVEVFPLSFKELAASQNIDTKTPLAIAQNKQRLRHLLDLYLSYGGFPEAALLANKETAFDILNAYSRTILYQDVAKRLQIKKPIDLEKLFYYLISNVTASFTYHNLSTLFDLADKTIKEYVLAFEEAFLLFEVDLFSFSVKKQIKNPHKGYSIDLGFVNSLAFKFSENIGKLLENAVFLELKRRGKTPFYYKTTKDSGVDFAIQQGKKIELIQVTKELSSPETREREIGSLIQGLKELKLTNGTVVTLEESEEIKRDGFTIKVLPMYKFLLGNDN